MGLRAVAIAAVTILITLAAAGGARSEQEPDVVRVLRPDVHHDRGEVLPITPERGTVVHETVWEVLQEPKTPGTVV